MQLWVSLDVSAASNVTTTLLYVMTSQHELAGTLGYSWGESDTGTAFSVVTPCLLQFCTPILSLALNSQIKGRLVET